MKYDNNKTLLNLTALSYPCFPANTTSLVSKYLTKEIFSQLILRKTISGFTLSDALKSGIINPDSSVGIYAGDAESYETFTEIFTPIIEAYHSLKFHSTQGQPGLKQPAKLHTSKMQPDFDNVSFTNNRSNIPKHTSIFSKHTLNFPNPDPENRYILSTRIRIARNLSGFPFTPFISSKERKEVEHSIINALNHMPPGLQGAYRPMPQDQSLQNESLQDQPLHNQSTAVFKKGDQFQEAAGINRDWPEARGVFESDNGKFIVWINEEDHLRIISLDHNGDISDLFNRLGQGVASLEENLAFAWRSDIGYLTACPSNLGTGMRAGVHIKLPGLFQKKDCLENVAKELKLQIRGTQGEKTEVESAVFDISNTQRLGISEQECCEILYKGICKIIEIEKSIVNL